MTPNTDTDADDIMDAAELTDDPAPLGQDLQASLEHLGQQVDLSGEYMGMPVASIFDMLIPMLATEATENPETMKRTLAVLHLESGALLDKHADREPVELAQND